jgi:hypothetical protein
MSLVPDTAAVQQSLTALDTSWAALTKEAQVLASADLQTGAWIIVQAAFPDIYSAMQAEQKNAAAFVALNVMPDMIAGVHAFAGTFQTESDKMLAILTSSAPLTTQEQQDLNAAMTALLAGLSAQVRLIQTKSTGAAALSDAITGPNGSFVAGERAVQSAIATTNQNLTGLEQTADVPGGASQAVVMGISFDRQVIDWLQGLLSTLQGLVQANTQMGTALSQTLVVWQTLVGKYQYVADQVAQAGGAGILGAGDLKSAQMGWAQIESFVQSLT